MKILDKLLDRVADALSQRIKVSVPPSPPTSPPPAPLPPEAVLPKTDSQAQPFVDSVEWERFVHPVTGPVARINGNGGRFGTLSVHRDEQYRLKGSIKSAENPEWANSMMMEGEPGEAIQGVRIETEARWGEKLILPQAVVSGIKFKGQSHSEVGLLFYNISRTTGAEQRVAILTDWVISGIDSSVIFSQVTKRSREEFFSRTRLGSEEGTEQQFSSPRGRPSGSTSRDHFVLSVPFGAVRVCKVVEEHAPVWARPMAIEYSIKDSEPTEQDREALIEALGFAFGRHILSVGSSAFDKDGFAVRTEANNPWGRDVIETCSRYDSPPVPLNVPDHMMISEDDISSLVCKYLKNREEMNLSQVVWAMWVAQRQPLSFDIPLYASAMEALMQAWFTSNRSKSKSIYMDTKTFRSTFKEGLKSFEKSAEGVPYGDRILRRLDGINTMGVGEKFLEFFDELGLPIDDGERAVIRARNVSAHGGKHRVSNDELARLGSSYRTLLNRSILKVIGYDSHYIDYSTMGYPVQHIDVPLGFRASIPKKLVTVLFTASL